MKQGYIPQEIRDNPEEYDTVYLLNHNIKSINNEQDTPLIDSNNIHEQILPDYEPLNQNDILSLKEKKNDEIIPPLKEDYTLLTLDNISHCQCCKNEFNSKSNAPFLLPCSHFFCKKCIEDFSSDSYTINCPIDGKVGSSFNELKLLQNLLDKEESYNSKGDYCSKHKDQKMTHFINETKEVICVFCAFNFMKTNNHFHIKEIKEKNQEVLLNLDKVLQNNQVYIDRVKSLLDIMKANKETVDNQIKQMYDRMTTFLNEKRKEHLSLTETYFSQNALKLSEKLEIFSGNFDTIEKMRKDIMNNQSKTSFGLVMDRVDNFLTEANESSKLQLCYNEFNFEYSDFDMITKMLSNWAQINNKIKQLNFDNHKTWELKEDKDTTIQNDHQKKKCHYKFNLKLNKEKQPNQYVINDTFSNSKILSSSHICPRQFRHYSSNSKIYLKSEHSSITSQYSKHSLLNPNLTDRDLRNSNQYSISSGVYPKLIFDYRKYDF